jgi:hypothetical protein
MQNAILTSPEEEHETSARASEGGLYYLHGMSGSDKMSGSGPEADIGLVATAD